MKRLLASCFVVGAICFAAWTAKGQSHLRRRWRRCCGAAGRQCLASRAQEKGRESRRRAAGPGVHLDERGRANAEKRAISARRRSGQGGRDTEYTDVKSRDYGQLAIVTGTGKRSGRAAIFFARIWVKRPAGWLLLTHQDTPILAKDSPASPAAAPAAANNAASSSDCENPCRSLPYAPKTAEQKEVVKAYQAVETAVTSHDAKTWADHVADEFVGIGRRYTGSPDTKAARVGQIGVVSNRVVLPKMLWGEAFVFGDAGIIIADHQAAGEPPYHVIRVWVKRDGRWQLFHRQETTIVTAAAAQ